MDGKLEKRRFFIYIAFSFGLTWIIFFAYILSGNVWAKDPAMDQFVSLGMLVPALAALLTRYVTKEGFKLTGEDSMLLGISFKDGKWKYFLLAMFLPWIYTELGSLMQIIFSPGAFDFSYPKNMEISESEYGIIYMQPFTSMISGTLVSFAAFGEEAGWRGYMMPKMIKLWGIRRAVVFGGIIWGIWHWPLTCVGHNFGREYFGYPFTGFAIVCIMCIFLGIILTFVTYKSGSIWPAAILHAVNNSWASALQYFINGEKITGWQSDSIASAIISLLPMVVIAVVIAVRERKRVYFQLNDAE